MNEEKIKKAVETILIEIGEDINREGIKYTPQRVARLYKNLYYGYRKTLKVVNEEERNTKIDDNVIPITIFNDVNSKELLIRKVNFLSTCEHHLASITHGECWVGIIPNKKILGMNKIDKIVKFFAARLQIQERMTNQIADWINDNIEPLGVIVVIKANHLCAELQGDNGDFTTSSVRGVFLKPEPGKNPKDEFLKLMGGI
jgi:GTP cyclohydrolase I